MQTLQRPVRAFQAPGKCACFVAAPMSRDKSFHRFHRWHSFRQGNGQKDVSQELPSLRKHRALHRLILPAIHQIHIAVVGLHPLYLLISRLNWIQARSLPESSNTFFAVPVRLRLQIFGLILQFRRQTGML